MNHQGTIRLETNTLLIRRFEESDSEAMFLNLYNNAEAMRYLPWDPHKNIEETCEHLIGYIAAYERKNFYAWAIVPKPLNEPIGFIDTVIDNTINAVKVDYGIGKPWWHNGYTSSALALVISFLFDMVGVNRIYATHDPRNPNSGKVMEKCGMIYEGTLRQTRYRKGEYSDRAMYAILAEDFNRQKTRR
ncbi:MAG: GNAT family N-acetyltransferase [Oscillospiraceae bacterium]|nr:GNAT family N-acetyltransferase [Oscillospiraceae bacterium]